MIEYIGKLDKLRRYASLSVAVLILITSVFITLLSERINSLSEDIESVTEYAEIQTEAYLERSVSAQQAFVHSLSEDWKNHLFFYPENTEYYPLVEEYIERNIRKFPEISNESMVVVISYMDEILYTGYADPDYEEVIAIFENTEVPATGDVNIYQCKEDCETCIKGPFGQGHRIFITGEELRTSRDEPLKIYVGFYEPIAYKNFINTLDIETVERIKWEARKSLYAAIAFLILIIVYGVIMIFLVRAFIANVRKMECHTVVEKKKIP